ncbi:hypothetical protein P152DRAFT_458913 [Eremomyces bilateralis CBS 781.70]|uniref:Uncharacterized protein n=1 Tax=Eremomyces bilateralis CBS 781.70 TaxID=1392243 RepID=A0A6G1G1N3_9PEZI|nr:uncharacterized protein P152DRAFT_458913 [Eremomyces bilateralis CBS 781.70]KAF1811964.1 hypothetical protein P152DRAFT_458913 [Eremomyces bilateralis CBS 781.70]
MNKSDSLDKQEIVIHGDNRMLEKLRGAVGQQIQPRIPEADITQYATGLDAVRVLMEAIFGPEKTPSREYLARIHQGEQFRIRYNGRGNPYWSSQIGSDRILSKEELQVIVQIVGDDLLPPLPLHLGVIWPEPLTSTEPDDRGVTHYSASTLGPGSPYGRTIWILFDKIDRSVDDSPCGWLGLVPFTGSGDGPPELPYTSLLNLGKSSIDAEGDLGPEFGPRWREDGVYSRFNGCQNPMPVQNQHADTDRLANSLQHPVPGTPERHVPHMGDPISPPSENRETRNRGTRNRGTRNPRIERGYPLSLV